METECYYKIQNSTPPGPHPSKISPFHTPCYFLKTLFNITLPPMLRSSLRSFHQVSPFKTPHAPLLSPMHAKCTAHPSVLYFITWIIVVGNRSWSLSIYSLPHSPVTTYLLGSNIFLSTPLPNTFRLWIVCYFLLPVKL